MWLIGLEFRERSQGRVDGAPSWRWLAASLLMGSQGSKRTPAARRRSLGTAWKNLWGHPVPYSCPPWSRGQPLGTVPGDSSLHWYETDRLNDFWLFHPLQAGVLKQTVYWWRQWGLWVSLPLPSGGDTLLGSSGAVCIPHGERTKGENHPIPVFGGRYLRADSSLDCISAAMFVFVFGFLRHTR